jgi:thiol-disulfide isomerase/thioredoxin
MRFFFVSGILLSFNFTTSLDPFENYITCHLWSDGFHKHFISQVRWMFLFFLSAILSLFQFDDSSFDRFVKKGNKEVPWFVMFGGPNCPACASAIPEFESASARARGFCRFAYADTSAAPKTVASLKILSIPRFYLFTESDSLNFSGAYSANGFLRFVSEAIGDGLEDADESWVDRNDNYVILFTRQFNPPALFSADYGAFKGKGIAFGMARDSETLEVYGNPPLPSIWFYKKGEKKMYKGKQEFINLIDKISEFYGLDGAEDSNGN